MSLLPAQQIAPADDCVDVSHGIGVPVGGLGTGYSVFGKFGFVRLNFNGRPDNVEYDPSAPWAVSYTQEPDAKATFGFLLIEGENRYALQSTPALWAPSAKALDRVKSYEYLPKGKVVFNATGFALQSTVVTYAPLLPRH